MAKQKPIYLDNQATTAVDPLVLQSMLPYFTENYGNAASRNHAFGWIAEEAVEIAREQVAKLIHADAREIIFTSGATESNNLAILGTTRKQSAKSPHVITVCTEHKAVLDTCEAAALEGADITYLLVDGAGLVDPERIRKAINPETCLVSVMHVNNEIGVIQPLAEIGTICRESSIPFHVDAAQSAGKLPIDVDAMSIDLLSVSAHKMYGPKGIGALYVRRKNPRIELQAQIHGGGHQLGLRSGTLPVPLIVGLGKACELAGERMPGESARILDLRTRLLTRLRESIPGIQLNGHETFRIAGNLNLTFPKAESESLIMGMPNIAVSTGSACTSSTIAPSYVLLAIGLSKEQAYSSLRIGIGRYNTAEEIEQVAVTMIRNVKRLQQLK